MISTASPRWLLAAAVVALGLVVPVAIGHADAPPGRYMVQSGTVVDQKTHLTWLQDVPTTKFTWTEAISHCSTISVGGSGWRVPSVTELQTIVDESRASPSIDPTAFPGTPVDFYWTSSIYAGFPNLAWSTSFAHGETTFFQSSQEGRVRCVR